MATDIQDLMAKAQQVINTNVETVKETRITQDTLQKNIEITDEKIGIHNVDEQAHLNIRSENNGGDEIGAIKWFAMNKAPAGYLVCNGAALLTSEYPKLYNAIGHTHDLETTSFCQITGSDGSTVKGSIVNSNISWTSEAATATTSTWIQYNPLSPAAIGSYVIDSTGYRLPKSWTISVSDGSNWHVIQTMTDISPDDITFVKGHFYIDTIVEDIAAQSIRLTVTAWDESTSDPFGIKLLRIFSHPANQFYIPNLINRVAWGSSDSVGTVKNAGLPNITGEATFLNTDGSDQASWPDRGCLYWGNYNHNWRTSSVEGGPAKRDLYIDASRSNSIYGASSTVQPPALCLLPCIKCGIIKPDITNLTTTLPNVIGNSEDQRYSFTISGTENSTGITYEISSDYDHTLQFSKTVDITNNEALSLLTNDVSNPIIAQYRGQTLPVTISAVSPSGGRISITHKIYVVDEGRNFTLSIPKLLKPNTTYTAVASGILPDPNVPQSEQQEISYNDLTFASADSNVSNNISITKVENTANTFTIQVNNIPNTSRGGIIEFRTHYNYFGINSVSTYCYINHLPVVTDATTLLKGPRLVNPNSTNTYTLEGATDPDGEAVTYSVAVNDSDINKDQITFSKSTGIADGEEFTLNCANVTEGTPIILNVTVTDATGESISLVNQLGDGRIVVNTPPDLSGVQNGIFANTPVSDFPSCLIPNHDYTVTIPNITDVNGDTVSCNFSTQSDAFTFSPKTNIVSGTNVTIHVNKNVIRGATYDFTFTANDSSGGSSSITVSRIINQLPNTDAVANPIGIAGLKPSTTYNLSAPSGATDADSGQVLTYHLSVDNPNITVSDYAGGHGSGSITIPDTSVIPRGTAVKLTMQVSDGLETVNKVFALYINNLPSGTLTHSVKSSMQGGANKAQTVTFSGITDSETVTYSLSGEGLTFSKSSGIAANESVTITAAKVAATTIRTLTVTPYDACGEAGTPVEIQITVEPIIIGLAPIISAPTEGQVIEGGTVTAIWSEYSTGPDLS